MQPLESRQYLSAVTLTGTAGADQIWDIRVNPNDASEIQVFTHAQPTESETPAYAYDRHDVTSLTINSDTGTDTFIVDFTYGTPLDGVLNFNGSTGLNAVQLIGRSNLLASYQPSTNSAGAGTITTTSQTLIFTSVSAINATEFQEIAVPVATPGSNYVYTGSTGFTESQLQYVKARVATTAALPTNTYNNGSSGVGATLTATANGALTVDGISVTAGDKVLVKNESTASRNGLYTVTNAGSGGAAYVLTRDTSMDHRRRIWPATGKSKLG